MTIEAMKQALEALEALNKVSIGVDAVCLPGEIDTAMDALRQAIEQAEKQEPVKMVAYNCLCGRIMKFESVNGIVAPQREWVGLTLDEIDLLEELYAPPVHPDFVNDASHCLELIRHIEAKLKEKNT